MNSAVKGLHMYKFMFDTAFSTACKNWKFCLWAADLSLALVSKSAHSSSGESAIGLFLFPQTLTVLFVVVLDVSQ